MMRWFRFYDDTVNDPKVQRLPAPLFRTWVNLLCLASKGGGFLPKIDEIAFSLRMTVKQTSGQISELKVAGLIDGDETLRPHNWNGRQYASDDVNARVKRHRQRLRNVSLAQSGTVHETARNGVETVVETPPESETEAEAESSSLRSEGARASSDTLEISEILKRTEKNVKGSRLSYDWEPSEKDRNLAIELGLDPGVVLQKFRDYWHDKPGKEARKINWSGTWRNWCRREADEQPRTRSRAQQPSPTDVLLRAGLEVADRLTRDQRQDHDPPQPLLDGGGFSGSAKAPDG